MFNRRVRVIDWSLVPRDARLVDKLVVECEATREGGKTTLEEYYADFVISTLPMAVLKQCHESMFYPGLDEEKVNPGGRQPPNYMTTQAKDALIETKNYLLTLIEESKRRNIQYPCLFCIFQVQVLKTIGCGHAAKIHLEWADPWWAQGKGGVALAWSRAEMASRVLPRDWPTHVSHFSEVAGQPNMLCCWIAGSGAKVAKVARWQKLIPSFPWIVPGWKLVVGAIQGKEGIKFCSVA